MVRIKQATPDDANAIHNIAEATWGPTYIPIIGIGQVRYMLDTMYSIDKLRQQISDNEQVYLLLLEDDNPVAFASYAPRTENPDVYKLHKLYCLKEGRGKGYGRLLVEAVEQVVLKAGKNILELNVNRHNPACGFYEKLGFSIAYEEDVPIGNYWMNDYVMRKKL